MLSYPFIKNESIHLLKLSTPVILSQLAIMGMNVTDVILAGQAGTTDLAGVTLGSSIWATIIFFFFGIGIANQPLVASFFGGRQFSKLRHQFFQSCWMATANGCVATLCIFASVFFLKFIDIDEKVMRVATEYLSVMTIGALAMSIIPVLRTTLESIDQARHVLAINLIMFGLNIPLDYALVTGSWGMPQLGGVGCAWASVFLLCLAVLCTYAYLVFAKKNKHLKLISFWPKPDITTIYSTFKLGFPIGLSVLIEVGFFNSAALVIANLGVIAVGAHAVVFSIASLSFMFYMGSGQAITILAAQRRGRQCFHEANSGIAFAIVATLILASLVSVAQLVFRYDIAALYSSDPAVIKLAGKLMLWSALFQLADALQVTALSALRAFNETKSPVIYQFFSFWLVGFPLGCFLTLTDSKLFIFGPSGFWVAMTISLLLVAALIVRKLRIFILSNG